MPDSKRPGVYFDETTEFELEGTGGKIPVFIGKTGNTAATGYKVDGTQVLKFKHYNEVCRSIANGGIGTDTTSNPLLAVLEEFFEEAEPKSAEDVGIPYIYVIDVGAGTSKDVWLTALTTAKRKPEAIVEVYYGAENISDNNYTFTDFIMAANASIATETANLNLRNGFITKAGETDANLIALNPTNGGILKSRIGIVEPDKFGKHVAMLCCTPYWIEPGFLEYRTVNVGEFKERTDAEIVALQNAGIIFGADEIVADLAVARMNLAVSTAYAASPRPADSLFHARFNADHLLREVFKAIFTQVKANETATYLVKAQTKVDAEIDAEVEAERMIPFNAETGEGTKLTLVESDIEPYNAELVGQIHGINCTHAINVRVKIKNPALKAAGV
ncbi:hypothetical protein [Methanobrevibacter sp.]|uniref:hypothetical protein n=1 Tax=Methanobrevibacter sp. TaxID=66852 RepID=UPI00388FDE55